MFSSMQSSHSGNLSQGGLSASRASEHLRVDASHGVTDVAVRRFSEVSAELTGLEKKLRQAEEVAIKASSEVARKQYAVNERKEDHDSAQQKAEEQAAASGSASTSSAPPAVPSRSKRGWKKKKEPKTPAQEAKDAADALKKAKRELNEANIAQSAANRTVALLEKAIKEMTTKLEVERGFVERQATEVRKSSGAMASMLDRHSGVHSVSGAGGGALDQNKVDAAYAAAEDRCMNDFGPYSDAFSL
jgi:hypothetical protein